MYRIVYQPSVNLHNVVVTVFWLIANGISGDIDVDTAEVPCTKAFIPDQTEVLQRLL